MAFELIDKEEFSHAFRRIAREQIERAIDEIEDKNVSLDDAIHDVRKCCKKIRGLLRLYRKDFPDYSDENAFFRDLAKLLSVARDTKVMVDTFDAGKASYCAPIDARACADVRRTLVQRRIDAYNAPGLERNLHEVKKKLREAKDRIEAWEVETGKRKYVVKSAMKVIKRFRKGFKKATDSSTPEQLHDWRKRAKYHMYHCRILLPLHEKKFKKLESDAHKVSDLLGDYHDFVVFSEAALEHTWFGSRDDTKKGIKRVEKEIQRDLEKKALKVGKKLLRRLKGFKKELKKMITDW